MNYLAHSILSGEKELVLVGNFAGDAVKGKAYQNYPVEMQKGILLHRAIDHFTDTHPVVKASVKALRPELGKWAAVAVDILYDHILARDFERYSEVSLENHVDVVYKTLHAHKEILPERFRYILPYMVANNWLLNYQYPSGIQRAFNGLSRRVTNGEELKRSYEAFETIQSEIEAHFHTFMPDLIVFVNQRLESYE